MALYFITHLYQFPSSQGIHTQEASEVKGQHICNLSSVSLSPPADHTTRSTCLDHLGLRTWPPNSHWYGL